MKTPPIGVGEFKMEKPIPNAQVKFQQNLKALRLSTGKTMYRVSKDTGLALSFYKYLEEGKRAPSMETIDILTKYFDIEPYELFL